MWLPGSPVAGGRLRPAAGYRDAPGHLDGLAAGGRRRGAAAVGGPGEAARASPRPSCGRRSTRPRSTRTGHPRVRRRATGLRRPGSLEPAEDEPSHTRSFTSTRPGLHPDLRLPGDARTRARHLQPVRHRRGRPAGRARPRPTTSRSPAPAGRPGRSRHDDLVDRQRRHLPRRRSRSLLPLNDVTSTVTVVTTAGAGAHSALMRVRRPGDRRRRLRVMNTIVVSNDATQPGLRGSRRRARSTATTPKSFFVTVPEGATVAAGQPRRHRDRFADPVHRDQPLRRPGRPHRPRRTATSTTSNPANTCKPDERSYDNPLPGVWEIEVEARRTSPALNNPFQLQRRVHGVTVDPAVVDAAERHRRRGDAGHLDPDQRLRPGRGQGSGRSAGQRQRAASDHRRPGRGRTYTVVGAGRAPPGWTSRSATPAIPAPTSTCTSTTRHGAIVGSVGRR